MSDKALLAWLRQIERDAVYKAYKTDSRSRQRYYLGTAQQAQATRAWILRERKGKAHGR